jgi:hypothetical protein
VSVQVLRLRNLRRKRKRRTKNPHSSAAVREGGRVGAHPTIPTFPWCSEHTLVSGLEEVATGKTRMLTTLDWPLPSQTASVRDVVLWPQVTPLHTGALTSYLRVTRAMGKLQFVTRGMTGKSVSRHNMKMRVYIHSVHRREENFNHIMKKEHGKLL